MAFRRGPNMSQYNANLNLINPMYGSADPVEDAFDQSNLDLFSNADFFDWEMGQAISTTRPEHSRHVLTKKSTEQSEQALDAFNGDYLQDFDLNLENIDNVLSTTNNPFDGLSNEYAEIQQPVEVQQQSGSMNTQNLSRRSQHVQRPRNLTILPQPSQTSPVSPQSHQNTFVSPSQSPLNPGTRRQSVALSPSTPACLEDASRAVAEEDKRRRNTAASARFRVKKKQREQAMESHAKELENKCQSLDNKVIQLETENKWLRDLLMEKHGSNENFLDMIKSAPFPLSSLKKRASTASKEN